MCEKKEWCCMMNELIIFKNPKFGSIRTITEDGRTLFCGSDVAKALGYKNPSKALSDHCKGVTKRYTPTTSGQQEMNFIPQGDIYRLATKSELPGAEEFESWIFDEILPSIHEHGAYMTSDTLDKMITSPEFGIKLLTALKDEQEKRKVLETENAAQRQAIADFQPLKQYLDTILSSESTMATSQIAADYDMSAKRLNKILHEEGIQHCVNGQWILYKEHMGKGYTKSITIPITRSDGNLDTKLYTQWSQKGRLLIHQILTARGIVAVMDRVNAS